MNEVYSLYMYDPSAVKIYTDGSAQPNPGRGGIGAFIEFPDSLQIENEEWPGPLKMARTNRIKQTRPTYLN